MALTKVEAIELLSREVLVDQPPVLNADDLDDLVRYMAVSDTNGLRPNHPDWIESYGVTWLNFTAAKAWERKAGRLAGLVTFTADGATFNAGDLHRQAIRMQRSYLSRCAGTVSTAGSGS